MQVQLSGNFLQLSPDNFDFMEPVIGVEIRRNDSRGFRMPAGIQRHLKGVVRIATVAVRICAKFQIAEIFEKDYLTPLNL